MDSYLKIIALLLVVAALADNVRANDEGENEEAAEKCWTEDCDNKLRDCGKNVVHCMDACHHGCMQGERHCEHAEVRRHGQGKTPFSARRKCHDINYNCIFDCFDKCRDVKRSDIEPCRHADERACYDTCAHQHDVHDEEE